MSSHRTREWRKSRNKFLIEEVLRKILVLEIFVFRGRMTLRGSRVGLWGIERRAKIKRGILHIVVD